MNEPFAPGSTVQEAARKIVDVVEILGYTYETTFNGTPIVGHFGDSAEDIYSRWNNLRQRSINRAARIKYIAGFNDIGLWQAEQIVDLLEQFDRDHE